MSKVERGKRKRVRVFLAGNSEGFKAHNQQMDKAWKDGQDWKNLWEKTMNEKK